MAVRMGAGVELTTSKRSNKYVYVPRECMQVLVTATQYH